MSTLRKILTTGVGAALMTEGGLRNAISGINRKGKEELVEMIRKALEGMTIEVEAQVRLLPKAGKPRRGRS